MIKFFNLIRHATRHECANVTKTKIKKNDRENKKHD